MSGNRTTSTSNPLNVRSVEELLTRAESTLGNIRRNLAKRRVPPGMPIAFLLPLPLSSWYETAERLGVVSLPELQREPTSGVEIYTSFDDFVRYLRVAVAARAAITVTEVAQMLHKRNRHSSPGTIKLYEEVERKKLATGWGRKRLARHFGKSPSWVPHVLKTLAEWRRTHQQVQ
jgi:hypothetical protein